MFDHSYIQSRVDTFFLREILGNHKKAQYYFHDKGKLLVDFPFIATVWHLSTGENWTDEEMCQSLLANGNSIPLTRDLSEEFGIPSL